MLGESHGQVPFQAHVELLQLFLTHREEIVEKIQGVLNAQRKPSQYLQGGPALARDFGDCLFTLGVVTGEQARLRGQLEEAHWASGFRPRQISGLHNDLIDPAEMAVRGFHCWRQTRWPGRNARVRYAQTLFSVYAIRCLALLSMRLWDGGSGNTAERLAQLQCVLDELWNVAPADQPALVRDARWLIPLAQSPTTDELAAYFDVAERVAEALSSEDRIEIQKATVPMISGHLRSQIRHYCLTNDVSLDEHSLILRTRNSNALDYALLIQGLVPLLATYEDAWRCGDEQRRHELAGIICQGVSADPELFLNRIDLLGAYSMIEHVFVGPASDGQVVYTPMGRRHLALLQEYASRIKRVAPPLYDDSLRFRPVDGAYSPFGVIYGTPSNLVELMALKTIQPDAATRFSLEDVFTDGDADKLAWVNGWRNLPHIDPEVRKQYDYPHQFAAEIFQRIEHALGRCVTGNAANDGNRSGRLWIVPNDDPRADSKARSIAELPVRYFGSSDMARVAAHEAEFMDQTQLLRDRLEGHFVVSFETADGWVAIKKDILTEVLGAGRDAKIAGLPDEAAGVLRLMCPGMDTGEPDTRDFCNGRSIQSHRPGRAD